SRGNIRQSLSTTYDFGFGQKDSAGNYRRQFDRTNLIANNAQPFYNAIASRGFNFNPAGARQN
ncbi:MAG TPA: hypothetical protein DCW74_18425, partial [Alteromonas australica]|nr:hypothetical protein [Alteromonas australica]